MDAAVFQQQPIIKLNKNLFNTSSTRGKENLGDFEMIWRFLSQQSLIRVVVFSRVAATYYPESSACSLSMTNPTRRAAAEKRSGNRGQGNKKCQR